jgi:hypothetical protein
LRSIFIDSEVPMKKLGRRFNGRLNVDPTLNTTTILMGMDPGQREALLLEIERQEKTPGPCMSCGVPTVFLRPLVIMPPDAQVLGVPEDEALIATIRLCPDHESDAEAGRVRAAMVEQARQRQRDGLDPAPLSNVIYK